ncbi:MAG: DNA-3-methyladenine glycosylase I [Candidatus Dormibacteraeota bacterium]|nr:DNA-3-methyladenine glycosylase I [Candidatus Dormibacteraeota bacterium]
MTGAVDSGDGLERCAWGTADRLLRDYHDQEWGVPSHDDRHLFEMLILEGAQAGLSWRSILQRRDGYRKAFGGFDPLAVAAFDAERQQALLQDPGIIRNRAKIQAAVGNARAFVAVQEEHGSFDALLWSFVDGRPVDHRLEDEAQTPVLDATSTALSRELRRRGFRFVGPTICYSLLQAVGLVNDHVLRCFRHDQVAGGAP